MAGSDFLTEALK